MKRITWMLRNAGLIKHLDRCSRAKVLPVLQYPDDLLLVSYLHKLWTMLAAAARARLIVGI